MSAVKKVDRAIDRFLERNGLTLDDAQYTELNKMVDDLINSRDRKIARLRRTVAKLEAQKTISTETFREKDIAAGIRQAIKVYGPITKDRIGSATKRAYAAILNHHKNINRGT